MDLRPSFGVSVQFSQVQNIFKRKVRQSKKRENSVPREPGQSEVWPSIEKGQKPYRAERSEPKTQGNKSLGRDEF